MHKCYVDMLECPACHGKLKWNIKEQNKDRIVNAKVTCSKCEAEYEVRDEIAVFLTPDLPRNDLWKKSQNEIQEYFKENPHIFKKLMNTPEDELNGADYFVKLMYFEEKKDYKKSSQMAKKAQEKIYTKEYIDGWNSQIDFIVNSVKGINKPIVDIASGRGYLIEKLLNKTDNYIVVNDFSPTVLIRDKEYFSSKGIYDRLSLIAFDARKTPFKSNSIEIMTSNLGIQNIENPGDVISEMNRICNKKFMSVMYFIDKKDKIHMEFMNKYGSTAYATRENAINTFKNVDWDVEIANPLIANIKPTPKGQIIQGVQIDRFPIQDTKVEYCVIVVEK